MAKDSDVMAKEAKKCRGVSPAMKLFELVRRCQGHQQERSWERSAHGIQGVMALCVDYGLEFHLHDFEEMAELDDSWIGAGGGEYYYGAACGRERGRGNKSACLSFEAWKKRKPFLIVPDQRAKSRVRIYIGFKFRWSTPGTYKSVECTSFADDGSYAIACAYDDNAWREGRGRRKIARRFKITHDDLRKYHKELDLLEVAPEPVNEESVDG